MKIRDRLAREVAGTAGTPARGRTAGPTSEAQRSAGSTDTIRLSDRGLEIRRARGLAISAPDIRETLVGEISGQIESGDYQVTGDDVAPKMIQEHLTDAGG